MAAEDELVLVERVFLKIGSAATDEQLEKCLMAFLPGVLLKLSSSQDGVRKKVLEMLAHINKRVKSLLQIQLPVVALLEQFIDPCVTEFVKNFTIIYIKMGFPRLMPSDQVLLMKRIMLALEGKLENHQNSLLQLLLLALPYVDPSVISVVQPLAIQSGLQCSVVDTKNLSMLSFTDIELPSSIKTLVLEFFLDILLLSYNFNVYLARKASAASANPTSSSQSASIPIPVSASVSLPSATSIGDVSQVVDETVPPSLSDAALRRLTSDGYIALDKLEAIKLGVIRYINTGLFGELEILPHLVIATADTRHSVVAEAERNLKRLAGKEDWNNPILITKLMSVFMGTLTVKGQVNVKPESRRSKASIQLRQKIFPFFLKSSEAANKIPFCIQVVFDSLFGTSTNNKLRHLAVQFVHHQCASCTSDSFKVVAPILMSAMTKLIKDDAAKEDCRLRSLAYVAAGKISRRHPLLITKDLSLIATFFDSLESEESECQLAIQESLSIMCDVCRNLDAVNERILQELVLQHISKENVRSRQIAVHFAKLSFPPNHIPSQFALLLAAGDSKEEVRNEALSALHTSGESGEIDTSPLKPDFNDMMKYIDERVKQFLKASSAISIGNVALPFSVATYVECAVYLRQCLATSAGLSSVGNGVAAWLEQAPLISLYVSKSLTENIQPDHPFCVYMEFLQKLLAVHSDSVVLYLLLEIVAVARHHLAPLMAVHIDWIKGLTFSTRDDIKSLAAELYAIISVTISSTSDIINIIQNVASLLLTNNSIEIQCGAIQTLGYLISFLLAEGSLGLSEVYEKEISEIMTRIVNFLSSDQITLVISACNALGEIGRRNVLPFHKTSRSSSLQCLVDKLLAKVQSDTENMKIREKVALTLGLLTVGDADFPFRHRVIDGLLNSAAAKQFDLHLTIGEALVNASLGPCSPASVDRWLQSAVNIASDKCSGGVNYTLEQLLNSVCVSGNHHVRQAGCIWLVAMTRNCADQPSFALKLDNVQSALLTLLAEQDETTQEVASSGLSLLYEKCAPEQKEHVVNLLVDTLLGTRRSARANTSEDTPVFAEGVLGKTPEGQGLSTYRELCSIANDLHQPDLIYKFMTLANYNAQWNSRKGAALGFTKIAHQARDQLAPHLANIVPKLYRYQFDPNPRIQMAMSSIWGALVPDTKIMVDKYLTLIVDDLLKNLTHRLWRVRESSCYALSDILRYAAAEDISIQLPQLLQSCFRVVDDVKETVRKAADITLKSLGRVCLRACEADSGKAGQKVITVVFPVLLNDGMTSIVEDVKSFSLDLLLKMARHAGPLLKPHVALLVCTLLNSLTTLEPQYLNYLSLHAAATQGLQEKLDAARIAASKMSPMMEVINLCIVYVDKENIEELIVKVVELTRSAVGIGTKAGSAGLVISLCQQCGHDLTPYAGKLLNVFMNGLNDRNVTVKKTYATTIGHLCKIAKDGSVEKLIQRLKTWYIEKDDVDIREACGVALKAICQQSLDIFMRHATLALPLVFLAMHNKVEMTSNEVQAPSPHLIWEELWSEVTPGTKAGINLYHSEILSVIEQVLQSQFWSLKTLGASALVTVASNAEEEKSSFVIKIALEALSVGRLWPGKENLLKAVALVYQSYGASDVIFQSAEGEVQFVLSDVMNSVLRECRKENVTHKMEALKCIGIISEKTQSDYFKDVASIVFPLLDKAANTEEKSTSEWLNIQICCLECLGKCWPSNLETQEMYQTSFCGYLHRALGCGWWRISVAALNALQSFFSRLYILKSVTEFDTNSALLFSLIEPSISATCICLGDVKYSTVRTNALLVIKTLLDQLQALEKLQTIPEELTGLLMTSLSARKDDHQCDSNDTVRVLLDMLMSK